MHSTHINKSYCHRGGSTPLLGETIPEHFANIVKRFPDSEAIVSITQNRRLTYAQLKSEVDILACGLLGLGFKKGERIGIWSTNNVEWLLVQMATAQIGVILVNINPAYRTLELAHVLQQSELHGLFVIPSFRSSDYISMLVEMIPELKKHAPENISNQDFNFLKRIIVYDPNVPEETNRPYSGFTTWQEVVQAADNISTQKLQEATNSLDMDDAINIQYTSGTTGFPKAVVLTHHNILNNAYFSALAMNFTESDRLVVPVPFYHCFGMVLANLLCFSVGACLIIPCEHFDAGNVLHAIDKEQCTGIHGVPTMFIAELEHPEFKKYKLSSLRTGIMAGAPCPPELMTQVMHDMHCAQILIGYGETEASPLTHLTAIDDSLEQRTQTVGTNLPHQEVKVVDVNTRKLLPIGKVGEIYFRGYHIMKAYYGDAKATAAAVDEDGWLASGDLGVMDANGYLKITGRLKEMIIRGGENIYPREIEDFIFTHPKVEEVAVFGIPDKFYGEEVMAWVQLHKGKTLTDEEIRAFCKGKIAHFKIPKYIWFVKEFPMTVTGKLQKYRMREIACEKLQRGKNLVAESISG
ncbi:MAG: AMP-binding protein [Gammaproteobacteria bacterium]|nr:AMP-binding protein [Gammaproteobacteria bacterium]